MKEKTNKKIEWIKVKERDIDILFESIYLIGQGKKYCKKIGIPHSVDNCIAGDDGKLFFDKNQIEKGANYFKNKDKIVKRITNITENTKKVSKEYEHFIKKIKEVDFTKISNTNTKKIFKKFLHYNYMLVPYSFFIAINAQEEAIKIIGKENLIQITPSKENKIVLEHKKRKEIAILQKEKKDIKEKIQNHIKKFGWLFYYKPIDNFITEKDLVKELNHITEIDIENKNIKISKENKKLIKIMKENAWFKTYRRELMSLGFFTARPLFEKIAKMMKLYSVFDLKYMASWEIESFLENGKKISQKELQKRKDNFVIKGIKDRIKIYSGKESQKQKIKENNIISKDTLKGKSVYKGIVKGKICIIRKKDDLKNLKKNSIITLQTLGTWMTVSSSKCKAIISEDGSILSHTAVVAREFKIPCIIGIKDLLLHVKNNELIEVDANKGIVKKISEKNEK